MRAKFIAMVCIASAIVGVSLSVPAAEQATTIFTTKDFRKDSALWTNPAYYRNNTVGQIRGMALNIDSYEKTGQVGAARRYGSEGTAKAGAVNLASPYQFTSAKQHYDAWLKEAKGGTKHSKATVPDWGGRWEGGAQGLGGGQNPASYAASLLTPKYREYFVQEMKAVSQARIWGAGSFCLPGGFMNSLNMEEFVVLPDKVYTLGASNVQNYIRWIYTDGKGHSPEQFRYPKWHGELIGFWNGDSLIVHTNQIKGWKGGISEFTDNLETIERYRRVGDQIQGEITLYDPEVFVRPVHAKMEFDRVQETRVELLRPFYNTCTDTNGPSAEVFMNERGFLDSRAPGDPLFWDETDPRPWGTYYNESDRRFQATGGLQGKQGK